MTLLRPSQLQQAGAHTFAFFTNGDGLYDQAGWAITEQES